MLVPCDGRFTLPRGASMEVNCAPWDFIEFSVIFCTASEMASLDWAATELEIVEMSIRSKFRLGLSPAHPSGGGKLAGQIGHTG